MAYQVPPHDPRTRPSWSRIIGILMILVVVIQPLDHYGSLFFRYRQRQLGLDALLARTTIEVSFPLWIAAGCLIVLLILEFRNRPQDRARRITLAIVAGVFILMALCLWLSTMSYAGS